MSTDNKQNNTEKAKSKKPKRKHFYHKGDFDETLPSYINTPLEVVLYLKRDTLTEKQSEWLRYLNDAEYYPERLGNFDKTQDVYTIMSMFADENSRNQIIAALSDLNNYTPYMDHIPLNSLSESISHMIQKKQNIINSDYDYKKEYRNGQTGAKILVQTFDRNIDIEKLLQKFDIIIFIRGEVNYIFASDPSLFPELGPEWKNIDFNDSMMGHPKYTLSNTKKTSLDFKDRKVVKKYFGGDII